MAFNRGKRSLAVNLKDPEVLQVIRDLADKADVIAESFRPGVLSRFGLDFMSVKKSNPSVVYLSVSGFGQEGPYSERPVTDAVIQAFSGWMTMNKGRDGLPQRSGMVIIDTVSGLYGFQSVAAALLERFRFGRGRWIDCNLMQCSLALQMAKMIEYHLQDGKTGNLYAPVGAFETKEGILNITAMRDEQFHLLCGVLGRLDLPKDSRFATREDRIEHEPALVEVLSVEFKKRPASEWAKLLTEADVMNAVVGSYADVFRDDHVKAVSGLSWLEQPGLGSIPLPNIPGAPMMDASSSVVGADTEDVLRSCGISEDALSAMAARGAILQAQELRSECLR